MNWTYFSLGTSFFVGLLANMINSAASEAYKKSAHILAENSRTEEVTKKLKEADDTIKLANEVSERESKEISQEISKWEIENSYRTRMSAVHNAAVNELNDHKESINYFNRKDDIENNAANALDDAKDALDYDECMRIYDRRIRDAQATYKRKSDFLSVAGKDDDDIVSELKKAEKKRMEETVAEAKARKEELKAKLSKEESRINRQKQNDLRSLENEISSTKSVIQQKEREASMAITKEREAALENIRNKVYEKRSESELQALGKKWSSQKFIEEQHIEETKRAAQMYKDATRAEKWGSYLKANEVPKWFVLMVGALPLFPAGYLIQKYVKFVFNTVKAM